MCKTENHSPSGLVFPEDSSSEEEISVIKKHLQNAGFSKADSDWLVDVFKRTDCFGDPNDAAVFREDFTDIFEEDFPMIAKEITEAVQIEKEPKTSLALLFSCMLKLRIVGSSYPNRFLPNVEVKESNTSAELPQWIREFQRFAKFSAESLDWKRLSEATQFDRLLPFLFQNGAPLNQVVNLNLLNPVRRQGWSSNDFNNPEQLEFWLRRRFEKNKECRNIIDLRTLVPVFAKFPEDVLGDRILGLCHAIFYTMSSGSRSGTEYLNPVGDGWRVIAHELIPFLELLDKQKPEKIQERSPLLKAWWHLSKQIYSWSMGGLESELSEDLRNRLVESATRHISILRSILRNSPEEFEKPEVNDFYDKAFYVLLCFAPPWKCIKPLLLAFSEMTKQAVASDLRTWREIDSTDNPPPYYSRVANWIEVAMYPQNLQKKLEKDQFLQGLRKEFAKFCLERLRTKVKNKNGGYTDEDFVEPRPAWRQCYVQALKALRVNPGGRAHRTLFWLLNNDPDEKVRELAKKAHKQVRHLDRDKPNLDNGASPRRPLFEAFWWLRQAHLITFGIEVDKAGAMKTRRTELHRTREKDDVFKRR